MKEERVVAVIQARMGSTRLPGKVLMDVAGMPLLKRVVGQVRQARQVDEVVVATSTEPIDDAIVEFCRKDGIRCLRGSEHDVLGRTYEVAKQVKADVVARITADCPLIDPEVLDRVVAAYREGGYDYVTNTLRYTYPDGLDVEVFSFQALERAHQEARSSAEREHVTPYLRTSGRFRTRNVEHEVDLSPLNLHWAVDEPSDLEFVRSVYARLSSNGLSFGFKEILQLLEREPALAQINRRRLARSLELKKKASVLIPSCSQTFSKGPTQFIQGASPVFLKRGQGCRVWDVDGNEYIDYPMALGPVILGHNYPSVTKAVLRQLEDGTTFTLPHPLEVELAEMLTRIIPSAQMVRFAKNGSDATAGAVRVARAYTGRDLITCCGYHGWQDWYIGTTSRNNGVPKVVRELTIPFEYNNLDSLKRIFAEHPGQVAAVIMEPVGVVEPLEGFLQQVRELAHREGAVLIFDEVITGFRLAVGGAQELLGVIPDLTCLGKAMANGYPLAAVVGRAEIMKLFDEVFFSCTFGGETLSLAAAMATITEIREKDVIQHLWNQGRKLKDGYNALARALGLERTTECIGLPPRTVIVFTDDRERQSLALKSLFQQECVKRGILFSGGQNISYSHSDADVEQTLRAYREALQVLATAIRSDDVRSRLQGEPVQPVFREP